MHSFFPLIIIVIKKKSVSFISDKTVVLQHFQVEALLMCQSEKNQAVLCQLWPWHQDHLSRQENCLELTGKLHLNRKFADLQHVGSYQPANKLIFPAPSLFFRV